MQNMFPPFAGIVEAETWNIRRLLEMSENQFAVLVMFLTFQSGILVFILYTLHLILGH